MKSPQRFKVIACEVLFREVSYCAARARPMVDVTFLPKGLHDTGAGPMARRLQQAIDEVDAATYDAILLAYGLCNYGICGLRAPLPLVVPRAHDCITLLLGSRQRYRAYFDRHPATYYLSTGWMERAGDPNEQPNSVTARLGLSASYVDYVARYGEEKAHYLMETLGDWMRHYRRLAYIDTGFGDFTHYKEAARREAAERGWEYEELQGGTVLLQRLLDGEWAAEDFLLVPPGFSIVAADDDDAIVACGACIAGGAL